MTAATSDNNEPVLQVGDLAPDFTLLNDKGEPVSLSSFRGRRVVVYFYPKADTPGCTIEACDFRDNFAAFERSGFEVLGISHDPVEDLAAFRDKYDLTFPLLSDPDDAVIHAYGSWGEKTFKDRTFIGVLRSTFVVGPDGVLESVGYGVDARGHVDALKAEFGVDAA
jgi:thioredoxin-dependent peroxiredoxin